MRSAYLTSCCLPLATVVLVPFVAFGSGLVMVWLQLARCTWCFELFPGLKSGQSLRFFPFSEFLEPYSLVLVIHLWDWKDILYTLSDILHFPPENSLHNCYKTWWLAKQNGADGLELSPYALFCLLPFYVFTSVFNLCFASSSVFFFF